MPADFCLWLNVLGAEWAFADFAFYRKCDQPADGTEDQAKSDTIGDGVFRFAYQVADQTVDAGPEDYREDEPGVAHLRSVDEIGIW